MKKLLGLEIYQPSREREVLAHVQEINPGPLDDGAMKRLFERIIDEASGWSAIATRRIGAASPRGRGAPRQMAAAGGLRRASGKTSNGEERPWL